MFKVQVDFDKVVGRIKPMHAVGGAFGSNRYVDIPNIFRNFDADVTDPAS